MRPTRPAADSVGNELSWLSALQREENEFADGIRLMFSPLSLVVLRLNELAPFLLSLPYLIRQSIFHWTRQVVSNFDPYHGIDHSILKPNHTMIIQPVFGIVPEHTGEIEHETEHEEKCKDEDTSRHHYRHQR